MSSKETIFNVLARADHGQFVEDLNAALREVNAKVLETGCKGEITIKVKVDKTSGMNTGLEVACAFAAKVPQPPRAPDLYFTDEEGQLSRKDPRQPDLPGTDNVAPLRS